VKKSVYVEIVRLLIVLLFTAGGYAVGARYDAVLPGITFGSAIGYVCGGISGRFLRKLLGVVEAQTTHYSAGEILVGSIGARAVPVPVDAEGLRPDLLAIALERHRPRLLYVQPTFHNPTTAVMGEARRREILALAARSRTMIVEDDWASGLAFDGPAPQTLHALDGGRHVIYLNTFSKKLLPGLRVGWIAAPRPVTERLLRLKQIRDCGTSPLLQTALHAYLSDGGLERHLARVLPANQERRDAMLAALEESFPPGAVWTRPAGGLFLWVTLSRPFDGDALFRAAGERGVHYSQGKLFHSGADGGHTLRLTYSAATVEQIAAGVRVLGSLVDGLWPAARAAKGRPLETMPIL